MKSVKYSVLNSSTPTLPSVAVFTLWHFWLGVESHLCLQKSRGQAFHLPNSLSHPQTDKASVVFFSCLHKDKTQPCVVPLCPISFSLCYLWCWAGLRSARWWWTGGVLGQCLCVASPPCQLLPVPASTAAAPPRFSARKPHWTVCPLQIWVSSTLLFMWHIFYNVCILYYFLIHSALSQSIVMYIYESLALLLSKFTSLSPWRLRNTSSGLSPWAGDESGTEPEGALCCEAISSSTSWSCYRIKRFK